MHPKHYKVRLTSRDMSITVNSVEADNVEHAVALVLVDTKAQFGGGEIIGVRCDWINDL